MKTNLMKSILHLKDDTEYQIPLRETEENDRAKVRTTVPNLGAEVKKETEAEVKKETEAEVKKETEAEVDALKTVEKDPDETQNQEPPNTEESNSDTNTESAPQVATAKAALDEMKKLASQEGVIHPSLFISNFSKILGLMERAMQLQVKESGSATKEKPSESTEQTKTPAEG